MGLKKYLSRYSAYEKEVLAKRKAKKRKLKSYKALKDKKFSKIKAKRKFSPKGLTKAIGNPYGVKY